MRKLTAQTQFDGQQQWTLEQARIDLGPKGPAHVQAQGQFNTSSQVFEGQVQFAEINPALLYSTLDSAPCLAACRPTATPASRCSSSWT